MSFLRKLALIHKDGRNMHCHQPADDKYQEEHAERRQCVVGAWDNAGKEEVHHGVKYARLRDKQNGQKCQGDAKEDIW